MEQKKEGGCCGIRCGCCVCQGMKALVMLIIGGVIGFFAAKCCMMRKMCMLKGDQAQMESAAPAAPAAPAAKATPPKKTK